MDQFVRDLMQAAPLAREEEQALARRARDGDAAARSALITSGLRSVALRARMLGLRGEELRDAVQSGAVGLIRAVDRFDPDRGVRLATYAWQWIGAEMSATPRRQESVHDVCPGVVAPPPSGRSLLDGLGQDEVAVLTLRFGLDARAAAPMTRRAVAEALGLTVSQVRTVEGKAMRQLREALANVVHRAPQQ
jgi:DNA-directed RNA polymerase sigma subunit (sigma70/sigma32)